LRVAHLTLEAGIPPNIRPGAIIEFCFFTDSDPLVKVSRITTIAAQHLGFSDWLEGDESFRSIIRMMRVLATETSPEEWNSIKRGAIEGLKNFEVFMTGAFEGRHRLELWAYDEKTDKNHRFGGNAPTEAIIEFCRNFQALLDEDSIRRGVDRENF
jgi:hypothetical protein